MLACGGSARQVSRPLHTMAVMLLATYLRYRDPWYKQLLLLAFVKSSPGSGKVSRFQAGRSFVLFTENSQSVALLSRKADLIIREHNMPCKTGVPLSLLLLPRMVW